MNKWLIAIISLLGLTAAAADEQLSCHAAYLPADKFDDAMQFTAPVWQKTPVYPFRPAGTKCPAKLNENGTVKFLWNENYLFVMADMEDSDIVQENDKDNQHHYNTGDVLEIFIRPAGQHCYWEIYATPNNHKTVFFYPSGGRKLPSCLQKDGMTGYQIHVELNGTLNNPVDRDKGWRCIAAIPMKELQKQCPLDFSPPWLVQVARYNYSVYLEDLEHSIIGITTTEYADYHKFSSYVKLYFNKNQ